MLAIIGFIVGVILIGFLIIEAVRQLTALKQLFQEEEGQIKKPETDQAVSSS